MDKKTAEFKCSLCGDVTPCVLVYTGFDADNFPTGEEFQCVFNGAADFKLVDDVTEKENVE